MKNFFVNIALCLASIILCRYLIFWKWCAFPLAVITVITEFGNGWNAGITKASELVRSIAIIIDMFGNVVLQVPLNLLFVTDEGYQYGRAGETISSATGKNVQGNTLTKWGVGFNKFLSFVFGANHAINNIIYFSSTLQ